MTAWAPCSSGWTQCLELVLQVAAAGLPMNSFTVSAAISSCNSHSRWEQAVHKATSALQQSGLLVNAVVYNSLISACATGVQWRRALYILGSVQLVGHMPQQAGKNAAVEALGRSLHWFAALQSVRAARLVWTLSWFHRCPGRDV